MKPQLPLLNKRANKQQLH